MILYDLLERLLPVALSRGFASASLTELAEPFGLTRGAFCHYFRGGEGGIKAEMARQLYSHALDFRRRYLMNPMSGNSSSLRERRELFARQMVLYLQKAHEGYEHREWNCPVTLLREQCGRYFDEIPEDREYQNLLDELWGRKNAFYVLSPKASQLERWVSGPFAPNAGEVMAFFGAGNKKGHSAANYF